MKFIAIPTFEINPVQRSLESKAFLCTSPRPDWTRLAAAAGHRARIRPWRVQVKPQIDGWRFKNPKYFNVFTVQSLFVENSILYFFTLEHPKGFLTACWVAPLTGASTWADQPVAAAARVGHVVVLDGIHRLPKGALVSALSRLNEGEVDLPRWQPAQSLWGFSTGGPGRAWGLAHTWGGLLVRDPSATWDDAPGAYNGVAKAGANGHTGAVPADCEYRHCGFIDTERHILLSGRTWGLFDSHYVCYFGWHVKLLPPQRMQQSCVSCCMKHWCLDSSPGVCKTLSMDGWKWQGLLQRWSKIHAWIIHIAWCCCLYLSHFASFLWCFTFFSTGR